MEGLGVPLSCLSLADRDTLVFVPLNCLSFEDSDTFVFMPQCARLAAKWHRAACGNSFWYFGTGNLRVLRVAMRGGSRENAASLALVFGLQAVLQLRHELGALPRATWFELRRQFADRQQAGRAARRACFNARAHEFAESLPS